MATPEGDLVNFSTQHLEDFWIGAPPTLPDDFPVYGDTPASSLGNHAETVAVLGEADANAGIHGQNIETLFHTQSDVVPAPAGYLGNWDPTYDEAAAYNRFGFHYPEIAEEAARRIGCQALGALTQHAETSRSLFETYKVIIPL